MEGSAGPFEIIKKYWMYVVLGVIVVNIVLLNLFLFFFKSQSSQTTLANVSTQSQNFCSQGCVDQMNQLLKSQKPNIVSPLVPTTAVTPTLSPLKTPTLTPTPIFTPTPAKIVKEFFIPLGAGTGNSSDWTAVNGIGAKIDPADYGDIKSVTFEVAAQVPTGNQQIWIRLYNAGTSQSVSGSDVTLSGGGTATLLISSPITLSSGSNLYQVQLKTQLQANTNIDMARLRIKTN